MNEARSSTRLVARKRITRSLVLSLLAVGAAGRGSAEIKISNDQIPKAGSPLKRMKLSRADVPLDFTKKVLGNAAPGVNLESLSQSKFAQDNKIKSSSNIQAGVDGDHVVAIVDSAKGHVDVVPNLHKLNPQAKSTDGKTLPAMPKNSSDQAAKAAGDALAQGVFGRDGTKAVLDKGSTLNVAEYNQGAAGAPTTMNKDKSGPLLTTFHVTRMVGDLPVFGKGSRGAINVADNGKIHGFSKHWQNASDVDTVSETRSQSEIADLIKAQLADLSSKGSVEVTGVQLGYYDSDDQYIQPVYQFQAKFTRAPGSGPAQGSDDYINGYVPIGTTLEAIPSLLDKAEPPPAVPQGAPTNLPLSEFMPSEPPTEIASAEFMAKRPAPPEGDPTIGRYVVRNDYVGWTNSANGFKNGILASGWGGNFSFPQYYWAYPYEFQGSKNSYINAVDVAEAEVHGDWWLFTTYMNYGEIVSIDSIPYPGLGKSAGGICSYLILHSCEVVPTIPDTATWPDKWWHVFGGLHSVFGYRTIMYIDDGAMYRFGIHMGQGANLVSSWLQDVYVSPLYAGLPGTTMHGTWKPYGRPSTISMCGREADSVYNTSAQPRAGCLKTYWY